MLCVINYTKLFSNHFYFFHFTLFFEHIYEMKNPQKLGILLNVSIVIIQVHNPRLHRQSLPTSRYYPKSLESQKD